MADFVLIHGTTQGPEGWERLVAELASMGHRSTTVDLVESEAHGVQDYVDAVRSQVATLGAPIVVAHSGAGVLLPAIARELRASHQVWLAAYVPDGRRSLLDEVTAAPDEVFNPEWLGQDPTSDPVLAAYFLFHDCRLDTLQWALTTLRRFAPPKVYATPVELAPHIPSTYVVAAQDRTLRPEWCRREAALRLGAAVVEVDAGHCPHVSVPGDVAVVLNTVAAV